MGKGRHFKQLQHRPQLIGLPVLAPLPKGDVDPAQLFLDLCSWGVPYGGEDRYYGAMLKDLGFKRDEFGNYAMSIAGANGLETSACFMCHLDTAASCAEPITRIVSDGVCRTDGKSILGADDRAGLTLLLFLVSRQVPGLYYLFAGEEQGCKGSMSLVATYPERFAGIKKAISFDRKGKTSVITHQCGVRTCSQEFALALSDALNEYAFEYEPDATGLYTDSREFASIIPECTNVSVGYYAMHSYKETQDLEFLAYLCRVCEGIDWEGLPVARDPSVAEYDEDEDTGYGYWGHWSEYEGRDSPRSWSMSASESYFGKEESREDLAYAAIEKLADDFSAGVMPDRDAIYRLIQFKDQDTVDMIEMLIDELGRQARWMSEG